MGKTLTIGGKVGETYVTHNCQQHRLHHPFDLSYGCVLSVVACLLSIGTGVQKPGGTDIP